MFDGISMDCKVHEDLCHENKMARNANNSSDNNIITYFLFWIFSLTLAWFRVFYSCVGLACAAWWVLIKIKSLRFEFVMIRYHFSLFKKSLPTLLSSIVSCFWRKNKKVNKASAFSKQVGNRKIGTSGVKNFAYFLGIVDGCWRFHLVIQRWHPN